MQLLNTLYLTTPDTYLRLDNDTLRVEVDHETRLRVPLHHLCAVVCFGHIGLSAPLMHRLAEAGIALVLLDDNGRFKARLEGAVSGNVLLRQAQFQHVADAAFTLDMARACVAGKIKNTRQVLQRGAREAKADDEAKTLARLADDLAASLRALPAAASLDALRGLEGEAARQYFIGLNLLQRDDEKSVAIDIFGDQDLNIDGSGAGDLAKFTSNVDVWSSMDSVVIHQGDSTKLTPEVLLEEAGGPVRFFSVDGGHTEEIVYSDMQLAEATLAEGGQLDDPAGFVKRLNTLMLDMAN